MRDQEIRVGGSLPFRMNDGIPPIWVISLERAQERRRSVCDSLTSRGIEFELVDAVDGRALNEAQLRRYSRARSLLTIGRGLGSGEIGCALSHLAVYQRLLDSGAPIGIVMEDDVVATHDLVPVVRSILDRDLSWDVITLHSLFDQAEPEPIDDVEFCGGFRICRYRRVAFGAQCYLLTAGAAQRLLDIAEPLRYPADDLVFRRRPAELRVLGVEPKVVVQREFESELVARERSGADPAAAAHELPLVWLGKAGRRVRGALSR